MNGASNFTLAAYAAAVRAKMLVEFDAAVKLATKSSDHVNVENLGDAIDYRTSYVGADGKPAAMAIGFDAPTDTGAATWQARAKQFPGLPVSDLKDQEIAELRMENALLKAKLSISVVPGREPIVSTNPAGGAPR